MKTIYFKLLTYADGQTAITKQVKRKLVTVALFDTRLEAIEALEGMKG